MRQYKRKRKVWPVVLTVVLVIVIAVGVIGAVVWNKQKSNIEALRYAGSYSKDEIAQKIEDHDAVDTRDSKPVCRSANASVDGGGKRNAPKRGDYRGAGCCSYNGRGGNC